jgi:PAS domain-containing protein
VIGTNRVAANRDTTSRLQHRVRGLREERGDYDVPVDELIEGVCIVDRHQTLIYANRAVCQMLRYDKDELIGRSPTSSRKMTVRAVWLSSQKASAAPSK